MSWERRPTKVRDPRSTRRYRTLRAAWLPDHHGEMCALGCGYPVEHTPTVEHTLPIRTILAMTNTWAEAVDLCCDTSLWRVAHPRCQALQGARAGYVAQQRAMGRERQDTPNLGRTSEAW